MAIERGVLRALQEAEKGSKQELQATALKAVLDAVKADGFRDIPVEEARKSTPTKETQAEISRFSEEARKALEAEGYHIYELTGQSLASLRDQGKPFQSTWHKDYPEFEVATSRLSEVALNPDSLFLPDSNRKTLAKQQEMVAIFSQELSGKIPGVQAIIGEAPDYEELAFTHLDSTGDRLFGEKYSYNYTRTVTTTDESWVAHVGRFRADRGLLVSRWYRDESADGLFVAPLVVPAGK